MGAAASAPVGGTPDLAVKRIYEEPAPGDGYRVLVDRLWPRGLSKARAAVDEWCKDVAPSSELRTWYHHEPDKWPEFRRRYDAELDGMPEVWGPLLGRARHGRVTLLFSSHEAELNNAAALREYLLTR